MHGLIFVTWEKYLGERFQSSFLTTYRARMGENPTNAPLASKVYDDALLLAGVSIAHELTHVPVDTLLREYGQYFLINGLTSSRCSYLLTKVHSGRDLLLMMRDAHMQMRRSDGLTPPVFDYKIVVGQNNALTLIYNSTRHLCPLLEGAIEGAAKRYGQQVYLHETTCMRRGNAVCRFDVTFSPNKELAHKIQETSEQTARQQQQQQVDNLILHILPWQQGVTLMQLQEMLQKQESVPASYLRLSRLLGSLQHLSHAGLVAHTANDPSDTLASRCYWRVPTFDYRDAAI